jgi:hypothetical protein
MKIRTASLSIAFALATSAAAHAQTMTSTPVKAGLWETTITTTMQMQLPPEVQAQLDAMPAQQQAMMKARMPGGMGGAPAVTTTHSCSTGQSVQDLMNQAQQKGSQCKLTNQTQTASGMSFDISCTMPQGAANGHSSFTMADSNHVSGTTHLTMQMSGGRSSGPTSMTMDSAVSAHYLSSDCGAVKPNSAVVVTK